MLIQYRKQIQVINPNLRRRSTLTGQNGLPVTGDTYDSIGVALASITDAAEDRRYLISVGPGVYLVDGPIQLKPWVDLIAAQPDTVALEPVTATDAIIIGGGANLVRGFVLRGASGSGGSGLSYTGSTDTDLPVIVERCRFDQCETGIILRSTDGPCRAILRDCYADNDPGQMVTVDAEDDGVNPIDAICDRFSCVCLASDSGQPVGLIRASGTMTTVTVNGSTLIRTDSGAGSGIRVLNGAAVRGNGVMLAGFDVAIDVPAGSAGPELYLNALNLFDCAADVDIQHVGASGFLNGGINQGLVTNLSSLVIINYSGAFGVHTSRTLTAGAGLTGGGDLSADRTFDVVANADGSIVVNADDIQVGVINDTQHGSRGGGSLHSVATALAAGFMSANDKSYLDALAAFTQGSVPFAGSDGKLTQDNTYFFWDNTNKRLGIGVNASLLARLDAHEATLGNLLIRLATATGGSYGDVNYSVSQHRTTTTNNTDANLATIPTQSNRAYLIEARVVAARTGGSAGSVGDNAMFIRTARASNIGGTLTINNVQSSYTHRDQAGWTADISSSGTNILVVINGNVNNNVEWHGTVIVQEIRYT